MKTETLALHTPGPWLVHSYKTLFYGENLAVLRQGDSRKSLICEVGPSEFGPGRSECEANARLIAAAPDLLKMLDSVTAAWSPAKGEESKLWEDARALVAKVESL